MHKLTIECGRDSILIDCYYVRMHDDLYPAGCLSYQKVLAISELPSRIPCVKYVTQLTYCDELCGFFCSLDGPLCNTQHDEGTWAQCGSFLRRVRRLICATRYSHMIPPTPLLPSLSDDSIPHSYTHVGEIIHLRTSHQKDKWLSQK